jgi:hypothetical protein
LKVEATAGYGPGLDIPGGALMRKDQPDPSLPPLSTRMIFLNHRVRMHENAARRFRRADATPRPATTWALLAALAALALLAVAHA